MCLRYLPNISKNHIETALWMVRWCFTDLVLIGVVTNMTHPLQTPACRLILAQLVTPLHLKHLSADKALIVHLFVQTRTHFWVFKCRRLNRGTFIGKSCGQSHYSLRHKPDGLGCCMHANGFCSPRHTISFIVVTSSISVHAPSFWFPSS